MLLTLAQASSVVVSSQMEGVTTAIVAFIFVCVVYPQLVKNKTQFYAAFAAVLVIILLHSLGLMLRDSAGFQVFAGFMSGLLQIGTILLLFASCGGVTLREIASDMARAYEVIRRGEEEKTVIIPLTGEMPKPRQQPPAPGAASASAEAPPANQIDLPPDAGWPAKKSGNSSIPLE
jgi:hypothetical protein